MIDPNKACFNFSSAIKELDEHLKSELPGCDISYISQSDKDFESSHPVCRFRIIDQTSRLRFSIRVYYDNKISFRSWGLDKIFWAIGNETISPEIEYHQDFDYEQNKYIIIERKFLPFNGFLDGFLDAPIHTTYDRKSGHLLKGYFVENNLNIEDIDAIILKIKIACTEGKFEYEGIGFDFKQFIPFFNPDCIILNYFDLKEARGELILLASKGYNK